MRDHFSENFGDNSPDFTNPHRPGSPFLYLNDATRSAVDQAYEARRTRLDYRHRHSDHGSPQRTLSLDEPEQRAVESYTARTKRMTEAWRQRGT